MRPNPHRCYHPGLLPQLLHALPVLDASACGAATPGCCRCRPCHPYAAAVAALAAVARGAPAAVGVAPLLQNPEAAGGGPAAAGMGG